MTVVGGWWLGDCEHGRFDEYDRVGRPKLIVLKFIISSNINRKLNEDNYLQ